MLQKGLSNRPSGAVALLIIGGSIVLNFARGENVLADLLWGNQLLRLSNWKCYAEQAACHLHRVFEEVVTGAPHDQNEDRFEKRERKMAEAPRLILPVHVRRAQPVQKCVSL